MDFLVRGDSNVQRKIENRIKFSKKHNTLERKLECIFININYKKVRFFNVRLSAVFIYYEMLYLDNSWKCCNIAQHIKVM